MLAMTQQHGGVVHTHATDLRPGDTAVVHGERDAFMVYARTYPGVTNPHFEVTLPDGTRKTIGKLTPVAIEDPTGEVARRVAEINIRAATNTEDVDVR